jgi:hypothetical protein
MDKASHNIQPTSHRHQDVFALYFDWVRDQGALGRGPKHITSGHVKLGKVATAGQGLALELAFVQITPAVRAEIAQGVDVAVNVDQQYSRALLTHGLYLPWLDILNLGDPSILTH